MQLCCVVLPNQLNRLILYLFIGSISKPTGLGFRVDDDTRGLKSKCEREMLRRKPSKIEVRIEDKEELEEARKRAAGVDSTATTGPSSSTSLLQHFDRETNKDQSSKSQRIGISNQ